MDAAAGRSDRTALTTGAFSWMNEPERRILTPQRGLIERRWPMWIIQMGETFEQPRSVRARHRERWEIVTREEIYLQNFMVGVWSAARNFAEEDHLEGVIGGQGLASRPIAIKYANHFPCLAFKARLFEHLALGGIRWHVTDVVPTAWQAPPTVRFFAHQQDSAVAKAGPAHVHLGRGVAGLNSEPLFDGR